MKTLHLIRHSIADDGCPGTADIDRPLSDRGESICKHMSRQIWKSGCRFTHVFVSPANRAQATIGLLDKNTRQLEIDWTTDNDLYTFAWPELLKWLESRDNNQDEVTVVGHNPAITELTNYLTGKQLAQVPPCTCLKLCLDVERWSDLYRECGHLDKLLLPPNSE